MTKLLFIFFSSENSLKNNSKRKNFIDRTKLFVNEKPSAFPK